MVGLSCHFDQQTYSLLKTNRADGSWSRFQRSAAKACYKQTFIRLDGGSVGVARNTVRTADVVVVLFGGRVPFVLRPQGDQYALVGDCYIQGMMDGEAIDAWRDGRLQEQKFALV